MIRLPCLVLSLLRRLLPACVSGVFAAGGHTICPGCNRRGRRRDNHCEGFLPEVNEDHGSDHAIVLEVRADQISHRGVVPVVGNFVGEQDKGGSVCLSTPLLPGKPFADRIAEGRENSDAGASAERAILRVRIPDCFWRWECNNPDARPARRSAACRTAWKPLPRSAQNRTHPDSPGCVPGRKPSS